MTTIKVAGQPEELPDGEYAVVELFGHTTLVGRISEVERFGAKMMALEALFDGVLLTPVFHGGSAIYRLTPIKKSEALKLQHSEEWTLPVAMRSLVPAALLPAPNSDFDPDFREVEETLPVGEPEMEAEPGQNVESFALR